MNVAIMIFAVAAAIGLAFAIFGVLISLGVWAVIRLLTGPRLLGSPVSWLPPKNVVFGSLLFGPFTWPIAAVAQLWR
jgi:hypothetical protein